MANLTALNQDPEFLKLTPDNQRKLLARFGVDPGQMDQYLPREQAAARAEVEGGPVLRPAGPSNPFMDAIRQAWSDHVANRAERQALKAEGVSLEPSAEDMLKAGLTGAGAMGAPLLPAALVAAPLATTGAVGAGLALTKGGEMGGEALAEELVPGTGEAGGEMGSTAAMLASMGLGGLASRLMARRASAPAPEGGPQQLPLPMVESPPAPIPAPAAGGGRMEAMAEAAKGLTPEVTKLAMELLGRKAGSMTGIPGAALMGGRLGRFLSKFVKAEAAAARGITPASAAPPPSGLPAGVDESAIKGLMKAIPGLDRAKAIELASRPGAKITSRAQGIATSTPAPPESGDVKIAQVSPENVQAATKGNKFVGAVKAARAKRAEGSARTEEEQASLMEGLPGHIGKAFAPKAKEVTPGAAKLAPAKVGATDADKAASKVTFGLRALQSEREAGKDSTATIKSIMKALQVKGVDKKIDMDQALAIIQGKGTAKAPLPPKGERTMGGGSRGGPAKEGPEATPPGDLEAALKASLKPEPKETVLPEPGTPETVVAWRGGKATQGHGGKWYADNADDARMYAQTHGKGARVSSESVQFKKPLVLDLEGGNPGPGMSMVDKLAPGEKDINLAVEIAVEVARKSGKYDGVIIQNHPGADQMGTSGYEYVTFGPAPKAVAPMVKAAKKANKE